MPDIQPVESEDTGVSVWVLAAVAVAVLALLSVPAFFLIRDLLTIDIGAPDVGGASGVPTRGARTILVDTTLTADHNGSVFIGANNVTLDCAGHTITGSRRGSSVHGINVPGRTGVTVKNCVVTGFSAGFLISRSDANTFTNNTVTRVSSGFTLTKSNNNTISRNIVDDANDWFGYGTFESSRNNTFTHNRAISVAGVAFMAWQGDNNLWEANEATDNFGIGFAANTTTRDNTFRGNLSKGNTGFGIEDQTTGSGHAGTGNFYEDNVCEENGHGASSPDGLC